MAIRLKPGSYFSTPGRRRGPGGGSGMPSQRTLFAVLLLTGLAVVAYMSFILPGLESLQCGADYATDVEAWIEAGSVVDDTPACVSQFPSELWRLEPFMAVLLLAGLAVTVIQRRGNLMALPAMAAVQVALWLSPSPVVALAVALIGIGVACLPWTARNWMGAASHIGGLVLWPSVALSVMGAADASTVAIPAGLSWLLTLATFAVLPGAFVILPIYGARINLRLQGGAIAFFAAVLLILLFTSASAAAGTVQESKLTPAELLLHVAQSGQSTIYAGFANVPAGAETYSFLQDGVAADVGWSSVRGYEARFTTLTIGTWTNPTVTGCAVLQCGHLSLAVPSEGAPGVPDFITVGAGPEVAIDATAWHSHPSPLTLYGAEYDVVATNSALIPVGVPVVLRWRPWDGLGAPSLPIR